MTCMDWLIVGGVALALLERMLDAVLTPSVER